MRLRIRRSFHFMTAWAFAALATLLGACNNFDKPADIPFPSYTPQLFVECYLQDSLPPRLALSLTQGYFDSVTIDAVFQGTVYLEAPDGRRIDLQPGLYQDKKNNKAYNWGASDIIYLREGDTWKLSASDTKGHRLTGIAQVPARVPLDSVVYQVRDNDTSAYCVAWFKDKAAVSNYYRLVVNRDSINGTSSTDGAFQDAFRDGQEVPARSGYVFALGDTVFVRLYSLDPVYFTFLQSATQAIRNNGNPFTQPNKLKATVDGGLGVFAALVYDQRRFVASERKGKVL